MTKKPKDYPATCFTFTSVNLTRYIAAFHRVFDFWSDKIHNKIYGRSHRSHHKLPFRLGYPKPRDDTVQVFLQIPSA